MDYFSAWAYVGIKSVFSFQPCDSSVFIRLISRGISFVSSKWYWRASFCFLLPALLSPLGSLWGSVISAVENAPYSLRCPLYNLVTLVLGNHHCGGKWQAMGLLAHVFPVQYSSSQKLPVELLCLSWSSPFYQAPPRWVGKVELGKSEFMCLKLYFLLWV